MESWGDIFGSFVQPSTRKNLKRHFGIDFELEAQGDNTLDENDPHAEGHAGVRKTIGAENRPGVSPSRVRQDST